MRVERRDFELVSVLRWCVFAQLVRKLGFGHRRARHVVVGEGCSMGYHGPTQNRRESWGEDMSRIALAPLEFVGSSCVLVVGIDRMWRKLENRSS